MSKLSDKIREKKIMNGKFRRTPKGECFMRYCQSIADRTFTDNDYIEDYENAIRDIISTIEKEQDIKVDRQTVATTLLLVLKNGKDVFDE